MIHRVGLIVVAAAQAEVGVWGESSPHGFFQNFPGLFGQHWVRGLGIFNEHLVRDYAAAELGLAILLLCAAIWFERRLVLVAGAAFLVGTVPHFIYHLTTTDSLSTDANALSLGAFAVEIAIVGLVIATVDRRGTLT